MNKIFKKIMILISAFALAFSMMFIMANRTTVLGSTEQENAISEEDADGNVVISYDDTTKEAAEATEETEEESTGKEATKDPNFGEDTFFADDEASYPVDESEEDIIWYSRTEYEVLQNLGIEVSNDGIMLLADNSVSVITGSTYTDYGCAAVKIRINGSVGFCVLPWSKVPNGVSANFADVNITGTSSDNSNYQLLSKLIYYGYGGGGDLGYGETITHFALSKVWYDMGFTYNVGLSWTYTGSAYLNAAGQAKVTEFINKVNTLNNVKGTLKVAQLYASGEQYQDIIYGSFEPIVSLRSPKITIHKTDENGDAVQDAQFTVYGYNKSTGDYTKNIETKTTDSDGEIVFSSLTDSNGNAYTGNGLFLVKETTVPDGYKVSENYLNDADKADFEKYGGRLYYIKAAGGDCVAYRDTDAITVIYERTRSSTGVTIRMVHDHTGYLISDVYDTDQYSNVSTCWWSDAKDQSWYDNKRMCRSAYGGWYRSSVSADDFQTYSDGIYKFSNLSAHTYADDNSTFIGGGSGTLSAYKYGGDSNADWSYTTDDGRASLSIYNVRVGGSCSYLFRVSNNTSSSLKISAPTWTHDGDQSDLKWIGGTIAAGKYTDYYAKDGEFDNLSRLIFDVYVNGTNLGGSYVQTQEYTDGIFVNENVHSITLKKEISGNMADMNAKWDFTITISGNPGDVFSVVQGDSTSDASIGDGLNSADIHVCLGNNESAVINGLTARNIYSISEDNANTDGYVTTIDGASQGQAVDNIVTFTNSKEAIVPTGIKSSNTIPAVILIMSVCTAAVVLSSKSFRKH